MDSLSAHYQYHYKGVKFDPYRVARIYNLSGPREHAVKKLLRGTGKGHTEEKMWQEVVCIAERALEMIEEDRVDSLVNID